MLSHTHSSVEGGSRKHWVGIGGPSDLDAKFETTSAQDFLGGYGNLLIYPLPKSKYLISLIDL